MKGSKKVKKGIRLIFAIMILVIGIMLIVEKNTNIKISSIVGKTSKMNIGNNEEIEKIMQIDASGDKVPVPEGYVGSKATGENEIDTGYVIYEGEEEVTDSNVATAKKTRNQYVWVPVPDASKMYGTDANGKKRGKLYNFSNTVTGTNYDELTGAYQNNWTETNGVMKISSSTGYREPDVVPYYSTTVYDSDSRLKTLEIGEENTQEFLMQLEQEFNNMIESVEKYGGFYIGRYETGDLYQNVAVVKQGNNNISNQTWYTMYKKCKTLKGNNNNVETSMIWGNQWDRTLMWLVESGNKTKEQICDSTDWGNYSNNTESGHGSKRETGYSESWKANNIYDLAGNVRDWTIEASSSYIRVRRGGYYYDTGSYYPASVRYSNIPTYSVSYSGCRATLYIK